jgi:putative PIN family toxin of toxin-antitoxin system
LKVFFDTNVLVSAIATRGLCADIFQVVLVEHDLFVSETVLTELRRVLTRKLKVSATTVDSVEAYLRRYATVVPSQRSSSHQGLEAADAAVFAEAASATDVLVTGDRALLELKKPALRVVSPRGLWEMFRKAT